MSNVNDSITRIFDRLGAETDVWKNDDTAHHRIGAVLYESAYGVRRYAYVYVSDHRQGRGQSVTIGQADPQDLDVRVSTNRRLIDVEHVKLTDLYTTISEALDEAC